MGKLLLVVAVVLSAWAGYWDGGLGGGGFAVSAAAEERSIPVVFDPEVSWRHYHYRTARGRSSEEDMRRVHFINPPYAGYRREAHAAAIEGPTVVTSQPPPCLQRSLGDVCEEDPDYDDTIKSRVLNLLSRDSSVNTLLTDPSLRTILNDPETLTKDKIDIRFGVSESPVCAAQETIIYPKRAKNSRDEWVFVLNQEGVQQALRVEKCISNGSSCNIGLPGEAKATCRQKYVYRRMLVLGTNKIEPEEVFIPSCCVCYTTFEDLLTRSRNATRSQIPPAPAAEPRPPIALPMANPTPTFRVPLMGNFGRSIRSRHPFIQFPGGR